MLRIGAAIALTTVSVAALAAGGGTDKDAAAAVQAALTAARDGDAQALEKTLDRPALREDLRRQMMQVAQAAGVEVDGGPSDPALDRMIGPDAVRLAAQPVDDLEDHLKKTGKSQVCLTGADADCVLTFAREKGRGAWRLVGMKTAEPSVDVGVDLGG